MLPSPVAFLLFAVPSLVPATTDGGPAVRANPKTAQKQFTAQAFGSAAQGSAASETLEARRKLYAERLAQASAAAGATAQPIPQAAVQGSHQGNPQQLPSTAALNGSDDCATADPISGTGTFSFDDTQATNGAESSTNCAYIQADVWFDWTCPTSGVCTWSMCGLANGANTCAAVYAGSSCPAPFSAISCNDNFCGPESKINFGCTAGAHYLLQLGAYNYGPPDMTAGQFSIAVSNPAANDDCSTPSVISGTGNFAFDNTLATTGTQGQNESLCANWSGFPAIDQDLWYRWTAPASGTALLSTCGLASGTTKIAAYAGTSCPVAGSALACNEAGCSMQSLLAFPATAGASYMIQLGSLPGLQGGSGWLAINVFAGPANDNCSTPTAISGTGLYFFDNTLATTGSDGQTEALCGSPGATAIDHDVWYRWTAPAGGCTVVSTCGSLTDTKLAVYSGSACPQQGSALACNDDWCGSQSYVRFAASAGQSYMIQVGTRPGIGIGGSGALDIKQLSGGIGNDECSGATALGGLGAFPFDNSSATTGCEGQNEPLCGAYSGVPAIENDIWFTWVAPISGTASLETCSGTNINTKVAVYLGGGCPTPGGALTCADDGCGPNGQQESIAWSCAAGATYLIQLGNSPGFSGGPGVILINANAPPANDDCNTPDVIPSTGTFPFSLFGASTGTQGQSESLCSSWSGSTAIENDVWFTWTPSTSGYAVLSLCAGVSFDSKVAVYAGSGCPTAGTALVCNDDYCSQVSQVCFNVVGGQPYTIQIGTFPGYGASSSNGSFDLSLTGPRPGCAWDDGTMENLLGWTAGGDMVWLNRFGAPGVTTVVSSVDVLWGSALFPGYNPGNGTPTDVCIWQDGASQDGDPSDANLLLQIPTTVSNVDTDTYVNFPITPLTISGYFFVGSHQQHDGPQGGPVPQYVAPMDETGCIADGVAWFFGDPSGPGSTADLTNPGNNVFPPYTFTGSPFYFDAQVGVRADCNGGPATFLCDPGVAGVIACPCGNPPTGTERGCNNSSSTGGAALAAWGTNSVASADLYFTTTGERPTATSVVLQGASALANGTAFGQGVRCFGGPLKRLYVKTASGGSILAPNIAGGDLDIPSRSAMLGSPLSAGQDRYYMVYYRDPVVLGGCASTATFNGTNTAKVTWQP